MKQSHALARGTRVRNVDGNIGSIEKIEYRTTKAGKLPIKILVLADDGHWRYSIPIKFVEHVGRNDHQDVASVTIPTAELPRYILEEKTTATSTPSADVTQQPATADAGMLRIPLAAEELLVTTRVMQRGTVHLHTSVETTEQSFTVPTTQERVTVERIPAAQFVVGNESQTDDIIIPVMEERLVVRKEQVVTEYIRIHKESVTRQREVRDSVRREILTIRQEHFDESEAMLPLVQMDDEKPRDPAITS